MSALTTAKRLVSELEAAHVQADTETRVSVKLNNPTVSVRLFDFHEGQTYFTGHRFISVDIGYELELRSTSLDVLENLAEQLSTLVADARRAERERATATVAVAS